MPEFLTVGHVTKDVLPTGDFTLGGTVTYASVTARNLKKSAAVVTSAGPALDLASRLPGIQIAKKPSEATTTFKNIYEGPYRHQYVLNVAEPLEIKDVPALWRDAPIVLLGPLVRELGVDMVRAFPKALLGVTAQGWMRQWDESGRVHPRAWHEAEEILPLVDALFFSYEDVGYDFEQVKTYASLAKIAVVTHSRLGAVVYTNGTSRWLPGFRGKEVDPTGAGDVFAAAYLVALAGSGNPFEAARFANSTASLSIEGPGISTIPSRDQVETRIHQNNLVDDISDQEHEMIQSVLI